MGCIVDAATPLFRDADNARILDDCGIEALDECAHVGALFGRKFAARNRVEKRRDALIGLPDVDTLQDVLGRGPAVGLRLETPPLHAKVLSVARGNLFADFT